MKEGSRGGKERREKEIWNLYDQFILEEFKTLDPRVILSIIYYDLQKGQTVCLYQQWRIKGGLK